MKLSRSGFTNDILSLSWWDLLQLACGKRLFTPGLMVQRR